MSKNKYTKPFLEIKEVKFRAMMALSFGDGTTDKMECKSSYFDYEEEEEYN